MHETKKALTDTGTVLGAYGQLLGNAELASEEYAHDYYKTSIWVSNLGRLQKAKAKYDPKDLFRNTEHVKLP